MKLQTIDRLPSGIKLNIPPLAQVTLGHTEEYGPTIAIIFYITADTAVAYGLGLKQAEEMADLLRALADVRKDREVH